MASLSSPCYAVISHRVDRRQTKPQTRSSRIPPSILLTMKVGYCTSTSTAPFFSQRIFSLSLHHLRNPGLFHEIIAPTFVALGIDTSSADYERVVLEIIECGLGTPSFTFLHMESEILVDFRTS